MAKLARERKLLERRAEKAAKKEARKRAAAAEADPVSAEDAVAEAPDGV